MRSASSSPAVAVVAAAPGSPAPCASVCPCCQAPERAGPHCLSCTEMRLSLPSSCETGWPPCKVSCTGAVEWAAGKYSISTGSCHSPLGCTAWGAKAGGYSAAPLRSPSLGRGPSPEPLPPSQRVKADSMGASCPLLATQRVSRSFQWV